MLATREKGWERLRRCFLIGEVWMISFVFQFLRIFLGTHLLCINIEWFSKHLRRLGMVLCPYNPATQEA